MGSECPPAGDLIFEQGYALHQPSEIHVRLAVEGRTIQEVWVAGRGTTRTRREIHT